MKYQVIQAELALGLGVNWKWQIRAFKLQRLCEGLCNGYLRMNMCSNEIGLHAQYFLTILDSLVNIIWGGELCSLRMAQSQWTLINHSNLRLAPILYGIDPGIFKCICASFNLANPSRQYKVASNKRQPSNQARTVYHRS